MFVGLQNYGEDCTTDQEKMNYILKERGYYGFKERLNVVSIVANKFEKELVEKKFINPVPYFKCNNDSGCQKKDNIKDRSCIIH